MRFSMVYVQEGLNLPKRRVFLQWGSAKHGGRGSGEEQVRCSLVEVSAPLAGPVSAPIRGGCTCDLESAASTLKGIEV